MSDLDDARGVLYPDALPTFHRRAVPDGLASHVRWYWIARWDLPPGEVSTQSLLPFPAANLVVQPGGITLSGPTSAASSRHLEGRGWAFGVLLRAVGLATLGIAPSEIVDAEVPFHGAGELEADVARLMEADDDAAAARVMSAWWTTVARTPRREAEGARLADRLIEMVETDQGIVGVEQLARRMGMSTRALQRLAAQHIGLSPLQIIRRYRLQEAALRLRRDRHLTIADVAAELGYADQSHLAADFRSTLGLAARDYRRQRQP